MTMSAARVVLRLTDVEKRYPGVRALKGVSFDVHAGEVHALVGENGAGKSTLMGVAAATIVPDEGTVEIDGTPLHDASPAAAQDLGLAIVYQHNSILDDLTVAENMAFAMSAAARPRLSAARVWAADHLRTIGISLDPLARAGELGPAERQLLEIAKALVRDPKVLVLDEPTESLTAGESELLFERIEHIRSRGAGVVYISHRLPEVLRVADRLTVLRDGEMRGTFARGDVSPEKVLDLIVGRSIDHAFPPKRDGDPPIEPLLEVAGLSGHRFHDVAMEVRRGEIVGLAGIEGNGQRELLRALAGVERSRGSATVAGRPISLSDPSRAQEAGIVYLPGDRHAEGLFLDLSVRENTSVLVLGHLARRGVVRNEAERQTVARQIQALAIKTPSEETPVQSLSGGNQQKVLFARAILGEPTVFLAEEPSRGVDAGARLELYRVLRGLADEGRAVVIVSSDALELQGLCDRVLVFSRGRIVRSLSGDEVTEANITGAALTATGEHHREERADRFAGLRRFASGDYAPSAILAVFLVIIALYTNAQNGSFLNERSVSGMLVLATALALIAFGQLCVLLTGGVDLSVGPAAGLTVVVLSFFVGTGAGGGDVALAIVVVALIAGAVGLVNGVLIRWAGLSPVLATLATYIVLQGVSLLLRPQPEGSLSTAFTGDLTWQFGAIPVAFVVAVVLAVLGDAVLKRRAAGLELRAVGSNQERARRMGARVHLTVIGAYVACALLTMLGGLILASQIGIGDPNAGRSYTLTSIAAVVLGGASIFGGRGSFIGALLGALLLQEIASATPFLGLGQAWEYWLPGGLILGAAALYAAVRRTGALQPRVA
jgi:ribose transport system permease protein/ribose transport system ATP-binding protein